MAQVYSGSKNEFIFGEEGGKGKNLSSFLRNLSLTGSPTSSRESIEEANSKIYGSLSYKKTGESNPNLASSSVLSSRPRSTRMLSSGSLHSQPAHNNSSNNHNNRYDQGSKSGHSRSKYKDLDDDWNADIDDSRISPSSGPLESSSYANPSSNTGNRVGSHQHGESNKPTHGGERLPEAASGKFEKFKSVLASDNVIDIQELRKLSWNGIPNELRAMSWFLLLGYLPTNRTRQSSTLKRKRQEYLDGIKGVQIDFTENSKTSTSSTNVNNGSRENQIYHQIKIDVKRTNPTMKLYAHDSVQVSLQKILYLWAIRHPASGYVQGINDLATPFYQIFLSHYLWQLQKKSQGKQAEYQRLFIPGYILPGKDSNGGDDEYGEEDEEKDREKEVRLLQDARLASYNLDNFDPAKLSLRVRNVIEADTYWCLSRLLENITDNYIHEQPGIHRQVKELRTLISKIEPGLLGHFDKEGIEFLQFAFRWMNCLLMRELPMNLIIRMWDTYLSEQPLGFNTFHTYVCAAFLVRFKTSLMQMDFQEIILFLQNPPTSNWKERDIEMMLSEAFITQSLYKHASAHLK
ncbi:uncharacterized protein LODBEIA_P52440 [Lodderomyces beijingensis]|uniref:Oxidant-induced cell-cycle arrest protein 5 n=1 Tax=Lodderomyces beijingensis TaxID=1775926 RepID=A0ABP0ZSA6_9ASCO